jgi:glutaredoxin
LKKVLILLILVGAGYQGWVKLSPAYTKADPLYDKPYVVVYGRNSCGHTQNTLKELKKAGVPFEYQIVDDKSVADLLHARMESSGIDTGRYNLPVVDVSNDFSIRPATASIIEAYDNSSI